MANICNYKVKVKGKRNACYAFFGSMSVLDGKSIISETGTEDETIIIFEGDCKWSVDSYCNPFMGKKPVDLPDDADEALNLAEESYWYNTVQERSEMFQVEVWCNSGDPDCIDDILEEMGDIDLSEIDPDILSPYMFEHYINGEPVYDDCPDELSFTCCFEDDE